MTKSLIKHQLHSIRFIHYACISSTILAVCVKVATPVHTVFTDLFATIQSEDYYVLLRVNDASISISDMNSLKPDVLIAVLKLESLFIYDWLD